MSPEKEKTAKNSGVEKMEDNAGGLKITTGMVVSVNISSKKSVRKKPVGEARAVEDFGFEGDAHAGPGEKQISLLAMESIEKMRRLGLEVSPGDFAENLTTSGLNLLALPVGTILEVGEEAVLEITRHGKTCHTRCAIFRRAGYCVMPEEGVFARVLRGGKIKTGDRINVRISG
ncbi:MAG: MOSC domain-containing protein [Candidatus Saccharicenans sp.]